MDKLKELNDKCKFGIIININRHRSNGKSAEEYLSENWDVPVTGQQLFNMIESNTIIEILAFREDLTILNSVNVFHHNMDGAIDLALGLL